jgi:hypothetical protein
MSTRTKHILGVVVSLAAGAAVEAFGPSGPYAHVAVGGIVVALLTQLKTALSGVS